MLPPQSQISRGGVVVTLLHVLSFKLARCQCWALFSCCVCGNSYRYYFHVHFSVRCWFCILVSEQILHVGLKWLSWWDDRRGQKKADPKLWESEWVAFIVATSPRGRHWDGLPLFHWPCDHSKPSPSLSSLVPNTLSLSQWKSLMRRNLSRRTVSRFCHFWGVTVELQHSASACLLHLVLFAWFKKKKKEKKKGSPAKASCSIYICVIHQQQSTPSPHSTSPCCGGVAP